MLDGSLLDADDRHSLGYASIYKISFVCCKDLQRNENLTLSHCLAAVVL